MKKSRRDKSTREKAGTRRPRESVHYWSSKCSRPFLVDAAMFRVFLVAEPAAGVSQALEWLV
jgi:hypothetical protein